MKTKDKAVREYLAEIGRKGGSVKSDKKAKAARRNGRKSAKSRKKENGNGKN